MLSDLIWSTKLTFNTFYSLLFIIVITINIPIKALSQKLKPLPVITKINIITDNEKLKLNMEKDLSSFQGQKLSAKVKDSIHDKVLNILKKKSVLDPDIKGPLFNLLPSGGSQVSYIIKQPYYYEFILKGHRNLSYYQLMAKKHREKIFQKKNILQKLILHIRNIYLQKGYAKVRIKSSIKTTGFTKTIYLHIVEGKLLKIKKIKLLGRFSRPPKYYINIIKKYSSSLIRKNIFNKEDFESGLNNLKNILNNEGYLQTIIYSKITEYNDDIIINVTIHEGPITRIKTITFNGNKYFSDTQLKNAISTKINTGLNTSFLEKDIQILITKYKNAGFVEMTLNNIKNIVRYDDKTSSINLHFDIVENHQIIVSDIFIKGAAKTNNQFIKKALSFKTGDILTTQKINRSIKQLSKLGVFSSVNILTAGVQDKTSPGRAVIVQVKESKPRSFRSALGLNTERILTAHGSMRLSHKNLFNQGRQIFSDIKVQSNIARYAKQTSQTPSAIEHQASLIYKEPFLLSSYFNGQIIVSKSRIISLYEEEKNLINLVDSIKTNFILQKDLNNFTNFQWTLLSWEGRHEFKKSKQCEVNLILSLKDVCTSNVLNIASHGLALSFDKRNNVVSTSDGFLSKIFIEYAWPFYNIAPSDEINFLKMEFKHFDFQPLFARWVWMNSIQGGGMTNLNKDRGGFPVSKSFILGGANSLRGFNGLLDGERVPDKEELNITGTNQIINSPFSAFFLLKTELRFPISRQLRGSIFYDGGMVVILGKDFDKPYRHSAGFGLRYKTPLGPIAGYIAFKISPKRNELSFLPHLSFGTF